MFYGGECLGRRFQMNVRGANVREGESPRFQPFSDNWLRWLRMANIVKECNTTTKLYRSM